LPRTEDLIQTKFTKLLFKEDADKVSVRQEKWFGQQGSFLPRRHSWGVIKHDVNCELQCCGSNEA